MADKSAIEWTDATWNPITGCTVISPGCTNCYAMKLAATRLRNHPSRKGLTKVVNEKAVWTGEVRFNEAWLNQPVAWKSRKKVFVCAHGDLFHEKVQTDWLDRIFDVMERADWHIYAAIQPHPDCGKPRLWTHGSKDHAVRGLEWPLRKANDIAEEPAVSAVADNVVSLGRGA